jgi:hypothetical protein
MPRTPKKRAEKAAPVADEVLDQFGPATGMSMEEIDAATRRLKAALVERMLGGELSYHWGYASGETKPEDSHNHRNGTSAKTVLTDSGPVELAVPRDRAGTFAPGRVAGTQGPCESATRDLHRRDRRGGRRRARRLRRGPVGSALPDDHQDVASGVGARHPVLRIPARRAARDLHHQRARKRARARPAGQQDARPLPHGRGRDQIDLVGAPQHHGGRVASGQTLARRHEPIRDPVWRPVPERTGGVR